MKVTEAFDLPSKQDITALGFVVKLEEKSPAEKQRQLVDEYVLTPKVREELPELFDKLRGCYERGEDQGRFIHGSFGSGKSHFLSMLGLLLEGNDVAWRKQDETISTLAKAHLAWLREARFLVVRVHMLTGSQGSRLDRTLYEATNRTLEAHGKEPFHFLNVDGVLNEARDEARRYGHAFWKQMEEAGIVGGAEDFEALATGSLEERERLALEYLRFKNRDPATAGLNPNWTEGLRKLAAHVEAQGYGGLVFLVDEFILWLSEKTPQEFKTAINQLTNMVDNSGGQRAVPVFVFVARQRRLKEFFPTMVDDEELEQHLDWQSKRFETTTLQDVELRHICRHRVLKRRHHDEVEKVLEEVVQENAKLLPALLQNADPAYLRDVYPFHPALIETLIDVSVLLQRERTALRLLYELLVIHNPDLELGKFIPVGRAFDVLLPEGGFDASTRGREKLAQVHKAWYQRFRPVIERLEVNGEPLSPDRRRTLDALVKTVLLGHISNRLHGPGGLTVERLVRLNDVEVKGRTDRGRFDTAFADLRALAGELPALQLSNPDDYKSCVVTVKLEGASLVDVMDRARGRVNNKSALLRTYFNHLRTMLGLEEGRKGLLEHSSNEFSFPVEWRGTQRRMVVLFGNVRELSDQSFMIQGHEEVRFLIDYPWDDPGQTVEKDRERARAVRRSRGSLPTVCWLPRHFNETEYRTLLDLAATEAIRSPVHKDLLDQFSVSDQEELRKQAEGQDRVLRSQLTEYVIRAYRDAGDLESLQGAAAGLKIQETELPAYIESVCRAILDQRFNRHPLFGMEPRPQELSVLCDWLVKATESTEPWVPFEPEEQRPLEKLGAPLELVEVGKQKAQVKRDGRLLKVILDACKLGSASWNGIDGQLAGPDFGLQPPVRNFLLVYVSRAYSYRVTDASGEAVEPQIDKRALTDLTLRQAKLLTINEWAAIKKLARALFDLDDLATHRTLREHERAVRTLTEQAKLRHDRLKSVYERLGRLQPSEPTRQEEVREALGRLGPLLKPADDPATALGAWLSAFPTTDDVTSEVVRTAKDVGDTLDRLNATSIARLSKLESDRAGRHLAEMRAAIGEGTQLRRLRPSFADEWNRKAEDIIDELLEKAPPVPQTPITVPTAPGLPPPPPPSGVRSFQISRALQSGRAADVSALLDELRMKLTELGGEVQVDIVVRRKDLL